MYIVTTQLIFGSMFTNIRAQLHASAIRVGHLQVVHDKTYQYAIPTCVSPSTPPHNL